MIKPLLLSFATFSASMLPAIASAQATHDWGAEYHTINRPSAMARCPTGYTAEVAKQVCHARSLISPKAQVKSGACPAGTLEEWGHYCTPSISDKSDRMRDVLVRHYTQDLDANMQLTIGKAQTMNMDMPPVLRSFMAATGNTIPALPTQLPMQCATGFGSGIESALKCNEAVGVARGQQAAAGAPVTTQEQITGVGATPAGAVPAGVAPAANPKDALKQGLKGLLGK
jgi:hypothetical protein